MVIEGLIKEDLAFNEYYPKVVGVLQKFMKQNSMEKVFGLI